MKKKLEVHGIKDLETLTHDEKKRIGCGTLYFTLTDIARIINVMTDLIVDSSRDISSINIDGYRISAERDPDCDEGFILFKESLI